MTIILIIDNDDDDIVCIKITGGTWWLYNQNNRNEEETYDDISSYRHSILELEEFINVYPGENMDEYNNQKALKRIINSIFIYG